MEIVSIKKIVRTWKTYEETELGLTFYDFAALAKSYIDKSWGILRSHPVEAGTKVLLSFFPPDDVDWAMEQYLIPDQWLQLLLRD